jgi:hypothetical protein
VVCGLRRREASKLEDSLQGRNADVAKQLAEAHIHLDLVNREVIHVRMHWPIACVYGKSLIGPSVI